MKSIRRILLTGAGLLVSLNILAAAPLLLSGQPVQSIGVMQTAQPDSIVQITAEAQGLALVPPESVPPFGTFWLVEPGAGRCMAVPLPCPPIDPSLPIYAIADGQFLVDGTAGQALPVNSQSGRMTTSAMVNSALEAQANAVVALIATVQDAQFNREFTMAFGLDEETDSPGAYSPMFWSFDTNSLWLEIKIVTNGLAYLNLHRATNKVYEIWSKTDLTLANWNIETEVWPTNTQVMPFIVPKSGRVNLFFWARDWTGVTSHGNTTPEWWFWAYFGTTALSDTNLDNVGNNLSYDYLFGIDPNVIQFSLRFTNDYVNASPVYGVIDLVGGVPAYKAVLINDTNPTHAVWQPYSPSVVANLNSGDGIYTVMVGLRGLAPNATPTWVQTTLTLNTAPLVITITNPVVSTVWQRVIQVQGLASKPLANVNYGISNAAGIFTNQSGFITGQTYNTNLVAVASYFQCYDLALTNGVNSITLRATDVFGNTATTNLNITLDYNSGTNPPALTLVWPTNNTVVAGTNFMLQGLLDDGTASAVVSVGASTFNGLVERDGRFSVANLPLSGTNLFTISATNAAGRGISKTLTVIQSTVLVTINPPPASQQEFITVTGTVSDNSHDVYVNSVKATVSGNLTWSANNVPVLDNQGSGQLTVNIYPPNSDISVTPPLTSQRVLIAMQPMVQAVSYQEKFTALDSRTLLWSATDFYDTKLARQWTNGMGGASLLAEVNSGGWGHNNYTINLFWPVYWPDGAFLPGTFWSPSYSEPYGDYAPSTWANATLQASGAVPLYEPIPYYFIGTAQRQLTRKAVTEVQLVAGGPAVAGQFQLIRLLVSAAGYSDNGLAPFAGFYDLYRGTGFEEPGTVPVPATAIQVLGQVVMPTATNAYVGEKYVLIPAGAVHDLPVSVMGTNSGNYSFKIQRPEDGLRIYDASSGQDLTDQTNTVIVGQQMNLICTTVTTNGPLLNNFRWIVPGFAISNYVVATDASSAMVVTNFPTNNATAKFYWVGGASNRIVQCSVAVQGKTVSAKAVFNVLRPTINFIGSIDDKVALNTNYAGSGGDLYLHFGGSVNNGVTNWGINCIATNSNLQGYDTNSNAGFWAVQIVVSDNLSGIKNDGSSHTNAPITNALDNDNYPTKNLGAGKGSAFFDAPSIGGFPTNYVQLSKSESFRTVLMFVPDEPDMIPIPMREINWNWSAVITYTNNQWSLTSSNSAITVNNLDMLRFPIWTNVATNKYF